MTSVTTSGRSLGMSSQARQRMPQHQKSFQIIDTASSVTAPPQRPIFAKFLLFPLPFLMHPLLFASLHFTESAPSSGCLTRASNPAMGSLALAVVSSFGASNRSCVLRPRAGACYPIVWRLGFNKPWHPPPKIYVHGIASKCSFQQAI